MYAIYGLPFTINIPPMLASIYHTCGNVMGYHITKKKQLESKSSAAVVNVPSSPQVVSQDQRLKQRGGKYDESKASKAAGDPLSKVVSDGLVSGIPLYKSPWNPTVFPWFSWAFPMVFPMVLAAFSLWKKSHVFIPALLPLVEPAYWAVSVRPSITTLTFGELWKRDGKIRQFPGTPGVDDNFLVMVGDILNKKKGVGPARTKGTPKITLVGLWFHRTSASKMEDN